MQKQERSPGIQSEPESGLTLSNISLPAKWRQLVTVAATLGVLLVPHEAEAKKASHAPSSGRSWASDILPPFLRGSLDARLRENALIDSAGARRITNRAELDSLVTAGELVPIPESKVIKVCPKLPEWRRFLRREAAEFLEDMASAFSSVFPERFLTITSAVRPRDVQEDLIHKQRNRNAAPVDGEAPSAHMSALAFDIGWQGHSRKEIRWLQDYFKKHEDLGLGQFTKEGARSAGRRHSQRCFHCVISGEYGQEKDSPIPLERASSDVSVALSFSLPDRLRQFASSADSLSLKLVPAESVPEIQVSEATSSDTTSVLPGGPVR